MKNWKKLAGYLGVAFLPSLAGAVAKPDAWYQDLKKPPLNPPAFVFGPVWMVLYTLMGLAHYKYNEAPGEHKKAGNALYAAQLVLNGAWPLVFFRGKAPFAGLLNIVALLVLIAATMREFRRVSPKAGALFIPYLLWVCFACYLTAEVARRNRE
jgi:tryptophan-rich sensory protein